MPFTRSLSVGLWALWRRPAPLHRQQKLESAWCPPWVVPGLGLDFQRQGLLPRERKSVRLTPQSHFGSLCVYRSDFFSSLMIPWWDEKRGSGQLICLCFRDRVSLCILAGLELIM